ncbi:metallophosphoesterase [Streptacidiphilus sp. N1-12]|uniref:Metallophosphoesterase n=2 Tax=Streptacidiphilus alkalitolerans TaxID=3342712 RepID=A0ABV6X8J9_9ACTN
MLVLAHLSDIHIDDSPRSAARARSVLRYLEALPFDLDAVLVTGDITDHGLPREYELARRILTSRHPVLTCPGNHDDRAAYREVLLGEPAAEDPAAPVNRVRRIGRAVIALCDSTVPGTSPGRLDQDTCAWLADVLDETPADTPVLIAFHHPPATLHHPFIDGIRQFDTEPLAALVAAHPNVVGLLCGHAHTAAATTFAGRPLLVAPGVVSTLRLPWEQGAEFMLDPSHPPTVAFHVLDEDNRLTTHYRTVMD